MDNLNISRDQNIYEIFYNLNIKIVIYLTNQK